MSLVSEESVLDSIVLHCIVLTAADLPLSERTGFDVKYVFEFVVSERHRRRVCVCTSQ